MAIYNFKCAKCDKELEVLQKYDDPAPKCEEHGDMIRQLNGTFKFTFTRGHGTDGGQTMR